MTKPECEAGDQRFVVRKLPWIAGGSAVLLYLVTLSHWISLQSLGTVARVSGWLWRPDPSHPLTFLALLPFRLLPEAWLPLVLNVFTAGCAGLVVAQLARSVALWRHAVASDDPLQQGKSVSIPLATPAAWIPPALAVLVCGLQLTFWENATSATGEKIGLLCFAYAIRCLLEYRNGGETSWLYRCAAVYCAGMTDHWMLVGYAPVALAALVWVRGFGPFLEPRFLLRLALCGLAGLSLYLLLPTLLGLSSETQLDFGAALHAQLTAQKQALLALRNPALRFFVLTALLPALLWAMRWRSHTVQFADDTRLGVLLLKATGHGAHAVFFVASLWIALNPAFTPQNRPAGPPMLPYYYLWALITGYCAGYFLLFKSTRPPRRPARLPQLALIILVGTMTLGLVWKNLSEVRATNSPALHQYARQLCDDLPAGKSVAFSEDTPSLLLLRAELVARPPGKEPLLVETPALVLPQYHQAISRHYGERWPEVRGTNSDKIGPLRLRTLVEQLAAREPVVYLHPSSGFFFEDFTDQANGTIHRLVTRALVGELGPDRLNSLLSANEACWENRWSGELEALAGQLNRVRSNADRWSRPPWKRLRLATRRNPTVAFLGAAYSKTLNHWGVQLRQAGRDADALKWFDRAIELNPDNLPAHLNAEYTRRSQQGDRARLKIAWVRQQFPNLLGQYENWWEVLSQNGPVDEPTFLLQTGRVLLATRNPRQATEAFARCAELAPEWPSPKLWLVQSHNHTRQYTVALELTETLQQNESRLKAPGLAQLLNSRTMALRGLGHTNEAVAYVEGFVARHREPAPVLNAAADLYASSGQFEKELALRQALVERDPKNPEAFTRQGLAEMRLNRLAAAVTSFTRALELAPGDSTARFLRAVAHLRNDALEASKADYEALLKQPDRSQSALFGLGSIAWRQHDTNSVIQYYQQFLSNAAARSLQFNLATERLRQMSDE